MNIIYDHQIFIDQFYGGPSRYYVKLIEEILKKENIKVSAALYVNNYLKQLPAKNISGLNLNKIFYEKIPFGLRKYLNDKLINKINNYYLNIMIKNFKPDLIHRTNFEDYQINLPVVITIYDLIHEKYSNLYSKDNYFRPKKKAIERADEIICISKNTLEDLGNYYDIKNKKVSVIHLGCEFGKENQINQNLKTINNNFLLFVGKRIGYKNFDNFIKAYSLSEKLKKDFFIYCFGGGNFTRQENKMFKELNIQNKIKHFAGDDMQLIKMYKSASALIYPSKYEGFGLPILEAMTFGCPVVCSNSSSMPEVGGDAAAYFDPSNIENIKEEIQKTLYSNSLILNLKNKGKKRLNFFSWKKCALETMNVYKKLL